MNEPVDLVDLVVVGAGAAGLMAGIEAGRAAWDAGRDIRIVCVDGARKIGAKILVAGGGRCNVTHHAVDEKAYAGSTRPAIRKVLRRFDVPQTVAFFEAEGVHLKREDTGKLFPTTDSARTVLDALLRALRASGGELHHPARVASVDAIDHAGAARFRVRLEPPGADPRRGPVEIPGEGRDDDGPFLLARRVILATGGKSLPKSGSDGAGHGFARGLGHSITDRVVPSLVPLKLADGHALRELSGLAVPAGIEVRTGTGKRVVRFENDLLCTHFGLSGPAALDVSRWWIHAFMDDRAASLVIDWLPAVSADDLDRELQRTGPESVLGVLRTHLPERLARALCIEAGADAATRRGQLRKDTRRALVRCAKELEVPVTGNRGYLFAEVTAGGVPLSEIRLETMESRIRPGVHLCGEICDVDGRIGGFNFQWAWASGHIAGVAAVEGLAAE